MLLKRLSRKIFDNASPAMRTFFADMVASSFEEITYRRLAERGFRPAGIIDVGAYHGNWSKLANRIFGVTPTLMVEAQVAKQDVLALVAAQLGNAKFATAVLAAEPGREVTFYEMSTASSLFPEKSNASRSVKRRVTQTLDDVAQNELPDLEPLFLKIDVQGAELEVLTGSQETLKRCELVQLEVAMLQYNEGAPLMPKVVSEMEKLGFLPIEVSGFSRPRRELVQIDLLFARSDSKLRPTSFQF